MGVYGCLGVYESLWMFMGIYECLWMSWVLMGIYRCLWVFGCLHGKNLFLKNYRIGVNSTVIAQLTVIAHFNKKYVIIRKCT